MRGKVMIRCFAEPHATLPESNELIHKQPETRSPSAPHTGRFPLTKSYIGTPEPHP
jgi:hypothetical protein